MSSLPNSPNPPHLEQCLNSLSDGVSILVGDLAIGADLIFVERHRICPALVTKSKSVIFITVDFPIR